MTSKQPSVRYSIQNNLKGGKPGNYWLVHKFSSNGEVRILTFDTNVAAKRFIKDDKRKTKETQVRQSVKDQLREL